MTSIQSSSKRLIRKFCRTVSRACSPSRARKPGVWTSCTMRSAACRRVSTRNPFSPSSNLSPNALRHSRRSPRRPSTSLRCVDDPILVNALQRRAAVVLQKSTREGFGLTVTEAMWKGAAVIGGDVGGIRRQIRDGENGFLVTSPDQAADRIVRLLKDPSLRERIGSRAKESVRERFLMSRLLEDWLDLLAKYERPLRG